MVDLNNKMFYYATIIQDDPNLEDNNLNDILDYFKTGVGTQVGKAYYILLYPMVLRRLHIIPLVMSCLLWVLISSTKWLISGIQTWRS